MSCSDSSSPKATETVLILKLRKILDEEKEKRKSLEKVMSRMEGKSSNASNNEDSLR